MLILNDRPMDDNAEPTFLHQTELDKGREQAAEELDSDVRSREQTASSVDSNSDDSDDSNDSEGNKGSKAGVEELYSQYVRQ